MHQALEISGVPERVRDAFTVAARKYLHRPDVTAVDVGWKLVCRKPVDPEEGFAVRIHVKEKVPAELLDPRERVPDAIGGVPTDVIEAVYRYSDGGGAFRFDPERAQARSVLQPGISIGHIETSYGTLGMFVRDAHSGTPCILSADHVLAPGRKPARNPVIVQPGPWDQFPEPRNTVAELWRRRPAAGIAIAAVRTHRQVEQRQFGSGALLRGVRMPRVGDILEKSGRTTGVTRARVLGFGAYKGCNRAVMLGPLGASAGDVEISAGGDSGAVWYDPHTHQAVAVQCMGEPDQLPKTEWAIAALLCHVEDQLGIVL